MFQGVKAMNHYIKHIAEELFSTDFKAPFYILSVIAFWYVFFLALFDIMELLSDLFSTYLLPRLRRMWGRFRAHVGRMWGRFGRALVACVWLKVKSVDLYRKFYKGPEKGKEGPSEGRKKKRRRSKRKKRKGGR